MLFSGLNFRITPEVNSLGFIFDNLLIDSTGTAEIGLSGSGNIFRFFFKNGTIYSPLNKKINNYNINEPFSISGSINPSFYQYYINDEILQNSGSKNNYTIQKFFVNTTGCNLSSDTSLYSNPIQSIIEVETNYLSAGILSGNITNNSSNKIRVFGSSMFFYYSQEDLLSGIITGDVNPNSSLSFSLYDLDKSLFDGTFSFLLTLNTSIGDFGNIFTVSRLSGLSEVVNTITVNTSGIEMPVEFFGASSGNSFVYTLPPNQSSYISYSVFSTNLSGIPQNQYLDIKFEPVHPLQSGYYKSEYITGININSTGQYAVCPEVLFTGYYSVTGLDWNSNSLLLSSGCTGNVPLIFSPIQFGTGASGFISTKKITLSGIYGGGINTFYIYNGLNILNEGTGYTQSPLVSLNTGIYPSCYDVAKISGAYSIYQQFNPNVFLNPSAAYLSGEVICNTGFVSGSQTGYYVSGILITNPGSGYDSGYLPRFSFVRQYGDTLTSNASGTPLMKLSGLYVFDNNWTLYTGISTQAINPLTGLTPPYSGRIYLDSTQNYLTFQVGYSGLDNTDVMTVKVTVTNQNGEYVCSLISGDKTYDTDPEFLKKKNLDSFIFFTPEDDLSFLLTSQDLDEYYSNPLFQNNGGLDLGDLDFN